MPPVRGATTVGRPVPADAEPACPTSAARERIGATAALRLRVAPVRRPHCMCARSARQQGRPGRGGVPPWFRLGPEGLVPGSGSSEACVIAPRIDRSVRRTERRKGTARGRLLEGRSNGPVNGVVTWPRLPGAGRAVRTYPATPLSVTPQVSSRPSRPPHALTARSVRQIPRTFFSLTVVRAVTLVYTWQ